MVVNYDGKTYNVEQVTGDIFRCYGNGVEIKFTAEFKNGMYFKISSVSKKNGKTYVAQRFHYPYIQLIREATFVIWKAGMLYDYQTQQFVDYENYMNWLKVKNSVRG